LDLGLERKTFVVGGASRGLGRAVAEQLVAEGAQVLLVARDGDALEKVADDLGEGAHPLAVNLTDPDSVDAVVSAVEGTFGRLDGALINAGGPPAGAALKLNDEQWMDAFQLLLVHDQAAFSVMDRCS